MLHRFNPKEWNHGYTGLLFIVSAFMFFDFLSCWFMIFSFFGILLIVDEILQMFVFGQNNGPIHHLYIRTLYKFAWVRRFNNWMDKLMGKVESEVDKLIDKMGKDKDNEL